jgi:formate dehydrogenase major subunit
LIECQELQWPCPDETHPGSPVLHARLWDADVDPRVPFMPSDYDPVADTIEDEHPFVLTTGRRLEFFNTGVQTRAYPSARQAEVLWIHPDDAERAASSRATRCVSKSLCGELALHAGFDAGLSRGLLFVILYFPGHVPTNIPGIGSARHGDCANMPAHAEHVLTWRGCAFASSEDQV